MPYYYMSTSQQNSNGSANTDTALLYVRSVSAGQRAYLQKLQCGSYATPADNAIRLRLQRATNNSNSAPNFTPQPAVADAPAAFLVAATLPTVNTLSANFLVQLAFNQRGTGLWAAFVADEAIGVVSGTAPNAEVDLNSQATAATVPINFALSHSE